MKIKSLWPMGLVLCVAFASAPGESLAADMQVPIVISPSVLNLESQGVTVTVHAEIPYWSVVGFTVTLNGVAVQATKADARGEFVAKFDVDDVKPILELGTVALTLSGTTYSGQTFAGTDTIRVIQVSGRR